MKKPLSITSPNHAVALATYFMLGLGGLSYVANKTSAGARLIVDAHGVFVTDIWAVSLMVFGLAAFGAAVTAQFSPRPEHNLQLEMWACIVLTLDLSFFVYLIIGRSGIGGTVFIVPFLLGTLFRAVQIFFELRLLKLARKHPTTSDPVLADPREEHGR